MNRLARLYPDLNGFSASDSDSDYDYDSDEDDDYIETDVEMNEDIINLIDAIWTVHLSKEVDLKNPEL